MQAELAARRGSDIGGHLEFLYEQVTSRGAPRGDDGPGRHARVAELGVRAGNSTAAFLAALEITRGTLWSVDIRPAQVPPGWHQLAAWRFLQADDLSPEALAFIPPQLDVLLIDTSHGQGATLAELEAYGPRVRRGGVILAHDTHWAPGDTMLPGPTGPVARALDQYCALAGREWADRPDSFGLGVIEV